MIHEIEEPLEMEMQMAPPIASVASKKVEGKRIHGNRSLLYLQNSHARCFSALVQDGENIAWRETILEVICYATFLLFHQPQKIIQ